MVYFGNRKKVLVDGEGEQKQEVDGSGRQMRRTWGRV